MYFRGSEAFAENPAKLRLKAKIQRKRKICCPTLGLLGLYLQMVIENLTGKMKEEIFIVAPLCISGFHWKLMLFLFWNAPTTTTALGCPGFFLVVYHGFWFWRAAQKTIWWAWAQVANSVKSHLEGRSIYRKWSAWILEDLMTLILSTLKECERHFHPGPVGWSSRDSRPSGICGLTSWLIFNLFQTKSSSCLPPWWYIHP